MSYSNVGITSELVFDLPSTFLPDSRKTEVRVQPYSSGVYSQPGSVIKMTIPSQERSFLNTQTMYLTGRITLDNMTDGRKYAILGSAYSFFNKQMVSCQS